MTLIMENILERIAQCIEYGKADAQSAYPPEMKGQDGADELTTRALSEGLGPEQILNKGFMAGMDRVGRKFSEHKIFVPQMLMAARAMNTAMTHIKPFFASGDVKRKGTVVMGTVFGDLHDIGKNLAAMMIEGAGWEVVDLGVDVTTDKFLEQVKKNPGSIAGLSAMLTTTMVNMAPIVERLRQEVPGIRVIIGGAPVNQEFCTRIQADFYAPDPQGAVDYLNRLL